MEVKQFIKADKEVTLYRTVEADRPLLVYNNFSDDGRRIAEELEKIFEGRFNFLNIGNLNWHDDMSPWECPALYKGEPAFGGGADKYLDILLSEIIPEALKITEGEPERLIISGYSLAGLFALYAVTRSDIFDRVSSISGSLWFPGIRDYLSDNPPGRIPDRIYLSLGDKEARTKNPMLRQVQDNTEYLAGHYKNLGIDVTYELNPGNHFNEAGARTVKGLAAVV